MKRHANAVAGRRSAAGEASSFDVLDRLVVFSDKDASLAQSLAPKANVRVVHPGLSPQLRLSREVDSSAPVVLFTGALERVDNWRSIIWFLEHCWRTVKAASPAARLVIAGAAPPPQLIAAARAAHDVQLTGYVDSLEPYYASATVIIAPILSGAGVKFKTGDAMLRGVPVVATSIGAEGIDAHHLLGAVVDDPTAFAKAVVSELVTTDEARTTAAEAWADSVYGTSAFQARIAEGYGELLGNKP